MKKRKKKSQKYSNFFENYSKKLDKKISEFKKEEEERIKKEKQRKKEKYKNYISSLVDKIDKIQSGETENIKDKEDYFKDVTINDIMNNINDNIKGSDNMNNNKKNIDLDEKVKEQIEIKKMNNLKCFDFNFERLVYIESLLKNSKDNFTFCYSISSIVNKTTNDLVFLSEGDEIYYKIVIGEKEYEFNYEKFNKLKLFINDNLDKLIDISKKQVEEKESSNSHIFIIKMNNLQISISPYAEGFDEICNKILEIIK